MIKKNIVLVCLAIEFAIVALLPSEAYTSTNERGEFEFRNVDAGKCTVTVQFVGMETETREVEIASGSENQFDFQLRQTNFRLEAVTVVATQSKSGSSTASEISPQAMDHMQTSSLTDLMSFLPGAALANSNLNSHNSFNIRTAFDGTGGGAAYGQGMNSLGTAIIVDGAPELEEAALKAISEASKGRYVPLATAGTAETTLGAIYRRFLRQVAAKEQNEEAERAAERYQIFLVPGLLLLIAGAALSRGRFSRHTTTTGKTGRTK